MEDDEDDDDFSLSLSLTQQKLSVVTFFFLFSSKLNFFFSLCEAHRGEHFFDTNLSVKFSFLDTHNALNLCGHV